MAPLRQYDEYQCGKLGLHPYGHQANVLQQTKEPTQYLTPSGELLVASKHKNKSKPKRAHIILFL